MTLVENNNAAAATPAATPGTERPGLRPKDRARLIEQVRVAVIFDGRQHDLTLPANASVASVVDSILRVLLEGETLRSADDDGLINPGTVTLGRINGEPLDRGLSLAQQSVLDGDLLILEAADAEVTLTPVVENASSAIAQLLASTGSEVTERVAVRFAAVAAAVGVLVTIGLLVNAWRLNLAAGQDWNLVPAIGAAALSAALLLTGSIVWWRRHELAVANGLWLSALVAAPAAAVMATPGPPQAWHAVFGCATAAVLAAALWRLTPAPAGILAWVTITAGAFVAFWLIRALGVSMAYLWVGAMAIALLVLRKSEGLAGRIAALPMPQFPTVTGKLVFTDADDVAAEALAAAETQGTPSMAELERDALAANTYLTALVAATSVFFALGAWGAVSPGQGRWWLATVYVLILAAILVFTGRAFGDRAQAITVVGTALVMTTVLAVKYAVVPNDARMNYIMAAAILGLGIAGLIIAATVPRRAFSPPFRKVVEWLEYGLIVLVPPLAFWLLNLYFLARNR